MNPFVYPPTRGPSDFFQPTSLLTFKGDYDILFGQNYGTITVFPWAFCLPPISSGVHTAFNFFNVQSYIDSSITPTSYVYATESWTNSATNFSIKHPLAGGGNINAGSASSWTQDPADTSTTSRWTSARVVSCALRVIPTANVNIKQGILTCALVPGKTGTWSQDHLIIPSPAQLRQLPTSYEIGLQYLPTSGAKLNWLPLDPMDQIFMQGASNDYDMVDNYYRSPLWMSFCNISPSDTYRVEVTTTVEFVPTLYFADWSPPSSTSLTDPQVLPTIKKIGADPVKYISGAFGDKLSNGMKELGDLTSSIQPYIGFVNDALDFVH